MNEILLARAYLHHSFEVDTDRLPPTTISAEAQASSWVNDRTELTDHDDSATTGSTSISTTHSNTVLTSISTERKL